MNSEKVFDYHEESQAQRLARKSKDSPFMILGIAGLIGMCGYGVYQFRNKGKMSTSVFLMQLRVAAQGTVVASLTLGLGYNLLSRYFVKDDKKE